VDFGTINSVIIIIIPIVIFYSQGRSTPVVQTQPHHVSRHSYLLEKRRSAPSKPRQPKPHNTPRPKPPKRKKQKKRVRRISDSGDDDDVDDVDSDPDFIV
jgi:hypothetical protein